MPSTSVTACMAELAALPLDQVAAHLTAHSNLPGPRGNLTLLEAFALWSPAPLALTLAADDDEYLAACGTAALGPSLGRAEPEARPELLAALTLRAGDERWRVREGAAMALQHLADDDAALAREVARGWLTSDDPLVLRAAIAGLCEPRLLTDPQTARLALDACQAATDALRAVPKERRREPHVRTLRQGLGYCWSVAVAGSPRDGLPRFAALPVDDPDVAWIDRTNRSKKRLAQLLEP